MQKSTFLLILSILLVLSAVSCQNPGIENKLNDTTNPGGGNGSGSPDGGVVTEPLKGTLKVEASRCKVAGKIHLSWNSIDGADAYRIYRYTGKTEGSLDATDDTDNVVYYDVNSVSNTLVLDTPYFYRVAALKNGTAGLISDSYVLGMYSSVSDTFENNEDFTQVSGNLPIGAVKQAVLYSSPDGLGSVVGDVDWYRYSGPAKMITFEIDIPAGQFAFGEVKFRFYYNGEPVGDAPQNVPIGSLQPYSFSSYNAADEADNDAQVYCKVWVDTGAAVAVNKVQPYSVKLIQGF